MKRTAVMGAVLVLLTFEGQARSLADQTFEDEVKRHGLDHASQIGKASDDSAEHSAHFTHRGDNLDEPGLPRGDDDDRSDLEGLMGASAEDLSEEDEDLLLISGEGTMEGQQRLQLNPELLKNVEFPEPQEDPSWWDSVVEYFEEIFS